MECTSIAVRDAGASRVTAVGQSLWADQRRTKRTMMDGVSLGNARCNRLALGFIISVVVVRREPRLYGFQEYGRDRRGGTSRNSNCCLIRKLPFSSE